MTDSASRNDPDPDNWFDEPDTSGAWEERSARAVRSRQTHDDDDDWVAPTPAPAGERSSIRDALRSRWAAVAGILVVCLLAGLAAAGVFSSDHTVAQPPAPITTPTTAAASEPTTATTAPAAPRSPLKPGDTGAAVKTLQRALARLGYPSGAVDGQYGPSTTKAVKQFQGANRLTADGVLGPKTLAALTSALARS